MDATGKNTFARSRRAVALAVLLSGPQALAQVRSARVVAEVDGAPVAGRSVQVALGQRVVLRVEGVGARGRVEAIPEGSRVRFFRVESTLAHVAFAPPNPGNVAFSNAVLFGPRHGRWIGYDRLEYTQSPVVNGGGFELGEGFVRVSGARPSDPRRDVHGDAGSVWIAAEVTLPDGSVVATASARDVDRIGLSANVMRVSFRESNDFVGWLSTYFNVPDVFGSNGSSGAMHQTDRYTGADCADVLIGAMRAAGAAGMQYTSVAGIGTYANAVSGVLRFAPEGAATTLRWGSDARRGDMVAIDYSADPHNELPRAWDHIGVLVRDSGPNGQPDGVLGPEDVIRHMGVMGLADGPIGAQGPIRAVLWRWRARARPPNALVAHARSTF